MLNAMNLSKETELYPVERNLNNAINAKKEAIANIENKAQKLSDPIKKQDEAAKVHKAKLMAQLSILQTELTGLRVNRARYLANRASRQ